MAPHVPCPPLRMAHLRAARRVLQAAAFVGWATSAAPLAAQDAMQRRASSSIEGSLALTRLHGSATWMSGITGLLSLGHRVSLGGAGSFAMEAQRVPGPVPGSDLDLRVAFGGVVGQFLVVDTGDREAWVRLLAGAGNAKLDLAVAQTQIASDNFGVIQPEVGGSFRFLGRLRAGAAVGYRITYGVEDLPGVGSLDLRGPSARVLLAFHHP